jgi:hypothetical protein
VTFEGSGCDQGRVSRSIAADGSRATLIFDDFIAVEHPNLPDGSEMRTCRVTVSVSDSEATGVQATSRGYVQLERGMTAGQHQHIISVRQGNTITRFRGPMARDYMANTQGLLRERRGEASSFTIGLHIEVDGPTDSRGMATIDSLDIALDTP